MIRGCYQRARRAVYSSALAGALVAGAGCGGSNAPDPAAHTAPIPPGVRAYVDPDTGELGVPAYEPANDAGGGAADQPLEVVPGKTTAGGVMVDLRGHFSYGLRASVSNDGRVTTRCDSRDKTAD